MHLDTDLRRFALIFQRVSFGFNYKAHLLAIRWRSLPVMCSV